jgi:hypothetical protein
MEDEMRNDVTQALSEKETSKKAREAKIGLEYYGGDEYVITVNGQACGRTVTDSEATNYCGWLASAIFEILESV